LAVADHPALHRGLGVSLYWQGRAAEAEAAFICAIRLKPDYVRAHCDLGEMCAEQGRLEDAERAYREAIRLKPDSLTAGAALRGAGAALAAGTLRSRPNSSSSRRGVPARCRRASSTAPGLSLIARVVFSNTRTRREASFSALAAAIEPASALAADSTRLSSLTKAPTVGAMRFLPSGPEVTFQSIVTTAWPRMFGRIAW